MPRLGQYVWIEENFDDDTLPTHKRVDPRGRRTPRVLPIPTWEGTFSGTWLTLVDMSGTAWSVIVEWTDTFSKLMGYTLRKTTTPDGGDPWVQILGTFTTNPSPYTDFPAGAGATAVYCPTAFWGGQERSPAFTLEGIYLPPIVIPPTPWTGDFQNYNVSLVSTGTTYDVRVHWSDDFNMPADGFTLRRTQLDTGAVVMLGTYTGPDVIDVHPTPTNKSYVYAPTAFLSGYEDKNIAMLPAILVPTYPVPPLPWIDPVTAILMDTGTSYDIRLQWTSEFMAQSHLLFGTYAGNGTLIAEYPAGRSYFEQVEVNPAIGTHSYVNWTRGYYWGDNSGGETYFNVPAYPTLTLYPVEATLVDTGTSYDVKLVWTSEFSSNNHLLFGTYAGQGTLIAQYPAGPVYFEQVEVNPAIGTHTYSNWTQGYFRGDSSGGDTNLDVPAYSSTYSGSFNYIIPQMVDTGTSYDMKVSWFYTGLPEKYVVRDTLIDPDTGAYTYLYPGTIATDVQSGFTQFVDVDVIQNATHSYRIFASPYTSGKGIPSPYVPYREYVSGPFVNEVWDNIQGFERASTVTPGITVEFDGSYWYEYSGSISGTIAGPEVTAQAFSYPDQGTLTTPADEATGLGTEVVLEGTISDSNASETLDAIVYGMEANPASPFKIIVVPDMQKYFDQAPFILPLMFNWIADQAGADPSIKFVLSEGDITDSNADEEWWAGTNAWYKLDGTVPYTVIPGNHDKELGVALKLNHYFNADTHFYSAAGTFATYPSPDFGGYNDMSANAATVSAGSINWLLVNVGDVPHAGLREFARDQADLYPNHKAILTAHGMLWETGIFYPEEKPIYTDTVETRDNFFLVLCGHRYGEVRRVDKWGSSRSVDIILANYQTGTNGGDGYLRILEFIPNENRIDVKTYSPYRDAYMTGTDSQFSIDVPMGNGTILGRYEGLNSGAGVSHTWSGLTPGQKYLWWIRTLDETGRANDTEMRSFTA